MSNQRLSKSPRQRHNYVYGNCWLLPPQLRMPCWLFLKSEVEDWLAWPLNDPTILDTSTQSSPYDYSAMAWHYFYEILLLKSAYLFIWAAAPRFTTSEGFWFEVILKVWFPDKVEYIIKAKLFEAFQSFFLIETSYWLAKY